MAVELTEICPICGEPVATGAEEFFLRAREQQGVALHRYQYEYLHGYRVTSAFQADARFPVFEEVAPDFTSGLVWLPWAKIKRYFTHDWMFELYEALHLKWRNVDIANRSGFYRRRTAALCATRIKLAKMLRLWLVPLLSGGEETRVFQMLVNSLPVDVAIERFAELYDLPKFWLVAR